MVALIESATTLADASRAPQVPLVTEAPATPYTRHSTPYILHTLHPTLYTPHPTLFTPYTLHYTPYTLHPTPCTLHHTPRAPQVPLVTVVSRVYGSYYQTISESVQDQQVLLLLISLKPSVE